MIVKAILGVLTALIAIVLCSRHTLAFAQDQGSWWNIQSIDTMKYSRDLSRQVLSDPSFDRIIDRQLKNIASTGANTVSIATPYDEEFVPVLKRWVKAARYYHLHVWFRGNFSGWEGWFGYPKITREQHQSMTRSFILNHTDLFQNGDIFTACPECENGGPGDPRSNGDLAGHRRFLIDLYNLTTDAFAQIGKNVQTNLNSMNGDVARLVMDQSTTQSLGGVVTIDHYVATPEKLVSDLQSIANTSRGKIVLGEIGVPIPDIHGNLTDQQQADWLESAFSKIERIPEVVGVNYWVNNGGSTALWNDDDTPKIAVQTIHNHYTPLTATGYVVDDLNKPMSGVTVSDTYKTTTTDAQGKFVIPYLSAETTLVFSADWYHTQTVQISTIANLSTITMHMQNPSLGVKLTLILNQIFEFLHLK